MPRHVAIIMDGNGRWATARGLMRSAGHIEGVNSVRRITTAASDMGIKYLTLYAFSTENWNRPREEVDMIMHLIVTSIEHETPDLIKNNVRLHVIGDMDRMPSEARERLERCISDTANGTGLNLVLAISYSSRWELTRAAQQIAREVVEGRLNADDVTSQTIADRLSTAGIPDPDLLIRTGGEMRVSNFLLWQLAYTEIVVTPKFWPDFSAEDLADAINTFNSRQRRFGLTGQQVSQGDVRPPGSTPPKDS